MTPFSIFLLVLSLAVFLIAWLKGGHAERKGVLICILAYLSSYAGRGLRIDDLQIGDAIADLIVTGAFAWLALRSNRWWPFAATASMILMLVVHASMVLVPELTVRGDMAARMGLSVVLVLSIFGGVVERWLAGERPVSETATWTRRRPAT
ncbi:hypothetical protein [Brevundimonas sp. Root1279]|uniref:hypothetical protein n=1 Tax=Brevundimonas sp. Root1279 TaxID=1736443 RepID=UPI0007015617|nr:hypothetical protein [Brevundimonas sp. Root1279]KQW81830.1 hypothetical protein ASC65_11110 [Brevundimonas sp. Root1279]